jgi:hypothetical protein
MLVDVVAIGVFGARCVALFLSGDGGLMCRMVGMNLSSGYIHWSYMQHVLVVAFF